MSILHLPNETIEQICREIRDDEFEANPLRALVGVLATCHRLNLVARPIAYRTVKLRQPKPERGDDGELVDEPYYALDRIGTLLTIQPDIGQHISSLSFEALSSDPAPTAALCSITSTDAVVRFCARTPRLTKLYLYKCFWEDAMAKNAGEAATSVTQLAITDATFLGIEPIIPNVAQHFPNLRALTASTAPGALVDMAAVRATSDATLEIASLTINPCYPIPSDLVTALLTAAAPKLDVFTLYIPLVATPPSFLIPDEIFLPQHLAIGHIRIVIPLYLFPLHYEVRDTWHFMAMMLMSSTSELAQLSFILDIGRHTSQRAARRLDAMPASYFVALLDELEQELHVQFVLCAAKGHQVPSWGPALDRAPEWTELGSRPNVHFDVDVCTEDDAVFHFDNADAGPVQLSQTAFMAWYAAEMVGVLTDEVRLWQSSSLLTQSHSQKLSRQTNTQGTTGDQL